MPTTEQTGITADTGGRLLLGVGAIYRDFVNYAARGTILGATRDGATVEIRTIMRQPPLDGRISEHVKNTTRIISQDASVKARFMEMTTALLQLAIPGAASTPGLPQYYVAAEFIREGDATPVFNLDHGTGAEAIIQGTLNVYGTVIATGVETQYVEGPAADYHVNYATGVITFVAGSEPPVGTDVTAEYSWTTGAAADHDVVTGGDVVAGTYLSNIALVANLADPVLPIVFILDNVLSDGNFVLDTKSQDEAGPELTLWAHWDGNDPAVKPWRIWRPV